MEGDGMKIGHVIKSFLPYIQKDVAEKNICYVLLVQLTFCSLQEICYGSENGEKKNSNILFYFYFEQKCLVEMDRHDMQFRNDIFSITPLLSEASSDF